MIDRPLVKDLVILFLAIWLVALSGYSWFRSATLGNELLDRALAASERSLELRDLVVENNRMSLFFKHDVAALCRATGAACSSDTLGTREPWESEP
ncbi:MAG: hypothetical protein NXI30_04555 [bacterium]|nr:hypothetical protein [bacterium]